MTVPKRDQKKHINTSGRVFELTEPHRASHRLIKAIYTLIKSRNMRVNIVFAKAGYPEGRWAQWQRMEHGPALYELEAVLNVLGYKLTMEPLPETLTQSPTGQRRA